MMGSDLNCVVSSIMAHDDAKIMYKNKIRNICNFEFSRFNVLLFQEILLCFLSCCFYFEKGECGGI